jgi:hypothetical protein
MKEQLVVKTRSLGEIRHCKQPVDQQIGRREDNKQHAPEGALASGMHRKARDTEEN